MAMGATDYMSLAAAGVSLAGGIIGASGAQQNGANAMTLAYANSAAHQRQAAIARRNAGIAVAQSEETANDIAVKNVAQMGQIRTAYGASGLAMSGSPLDVIANTAAEQTLDIKKTLYKGQVIAAGLEDQANTDDQLAAIDIYTGQVAQTASGYQSAASLLGGVSGAFKSLIPSPYAAGRVAGGTAP